MQRIKASCYATAMAFRRALEDRIKKWSLAENVDVQRLRRQIAFDRLLCRLFHDPNSPWLLKGGYAMELRFKSARTTRDIDLALRPPPLLKGGWEQNARAILEMLREAGSRDLQDFFVFLIGDPVLDLDAAPYGGSRYPVEARVDGRLFTKFRLDVSAGDVQREPYEHLQGRDWLAFAGISGAAFSTISQEEQFAEKFHAYTLPRAERPNSRVKDLVDLTLLLRQGSLNQARLGVSILDTFKRRKTHEIPVALPEPPGQWKEPFAELATECGLSAAIMPHYEALRSYLQEILKLSP